MSENKHSIHTEVIKTVEYEILVLGLPNSDLEDILTHFVSERGKISKSLYEDFLIANCIANLNQFMAHINSETMAGTIDLVKLRKEVTELILGHNKALRPSNIIINKNHVLKLKTSDKFDGIALEENLYWNKSYYDDQGNYKPLTKDDSKNDMQKPRTRKNKADDADLTELDYIEVDIWWDRLREYISIKQYTPKNIEKILTQRYFHNSTSFNTAMVSNCITNVESIYERIDGMGANVDPNKVIRELFELVEGVNEGLNFTRARELQDPDMEDSEENTGGVQRAKTRGFGPKKKKKIKKARFKDVSKKDLLGLNNAMKISVIGQDDAVDVLTESINRASVGLKDPVKPIGSFLFAGRTGCGKTMTSKVLANELIKTKKNRIVIDCSEYSSDHEYSKLIGSPAGYIGHDQGGILTNAVEKAPFSVVVFDELEKASSKVYDLLLQILDEGRLTDNKGTSVSFKDTIIIMTSNIGVQEVEEVSKTIGFGDVAVLTETKKEGALNSALKKKFKPEFLNRLDSIVYFKDLDEDSYMKIIDIELYKLIENLKNNDTEYKDITLEFDKKIKKYIFDKGVDVKFGARPITRAIEKHISTEIANVLLHTEITPYAKIVVSMKNNKVTTRIVDKEKEQETKLLLHSTNKGNR